MRIVTMLLGVLVCAAALGPGSASESAEILAESKPLPSPTYINSRADQIQLYGRSTDQLLAYARSHGKHLYVVLQDVRAERNPGVIFEVRIGSRMSDGNVRMVDSASGHLNFYELRHDVLSYEVGDQLKHLDCDGSEACGLVVQFRPAVGGGITSDAEIQHEIDAARISVGRVQLVAD